MGSENEIELRPEEFEEFFKKSMDLILKGSELHDLLKNITMERLTSVYGGKPFYQGEGIEMMVQFYAYYTVNIAKLNSFYSKLWEYLVYVSEKIHYSDEKLAKMIDDYMSSPKGGE